MKTGTKIGIAVIVLFLVGVFVYSQNTSAPGSADTKEESTPTTDEAPAATGDVDATIDALLLDSSEDALRFNNDTQAQSSLIGADEQVVSDFGQTYDEQEF